MPYFYLDFLSGFPGVGFVFAGAADRQRDGFDIVASFEGGYEVNNFLVVNF